MEYPQRLMSDLLQITSMKRPDSPDTLLYSLRLLIQVHLREKLTLQILFGGRE